MRIKINLKACIKTGQCYYMHPDLVERGQDDSPIVIDREITEGERPDAESLIGSCPVGAIRLSRKTQTG